MYKKYDKVISLIVKRYEVLETQIIYELVKELAKINLDLTPEQFLKEVERLQLINPRLNKLINSIDTSLTFDFKPLMSEVGKSFIDYNMLNKAFDMNVINIKPADFRFDTIINSHSKRLDKEMRAIRKKTLEGTYKGTYKYLKKASLDVEIGGKTPQKAMIDTVKEMSKKGVTADTFLRHDKRTNKTTEVHQSLEPVVARAIRTSFIQTASDMQEHIAVELNNDKWLMSQHLGARVTKFNDFTNHAWWQGKVFTTEELKTICGKDEPQGYLGYNCRHIARVYIEGVSVKPPKRINEQHNAKIYELEQKQRRYERLIRATKKEINSLELLQGEDVEVALKNAKDVLRKQRATIREFIKQNDTILQRNYDNERVVKP